jgi:hypothetical protein
MRRSKRLTGGTSLIILMKAKEIYKYLFYFFYEVVDRAAEKSTLSRMKAVACIDVLELFFCLSAISYYELYTYEKIPPSTEKRLYWFLGAGILAINYFSFQHRDRGDVILREFKKWPKKKKQLGNIIVGVIVMLVLANFILSSFVLT